MNRIFRLFFLVLSFTPLLFSQQNGALRGFVTDSTSGEVIIYANVIIQGTMQGSPTDTKGYYYIPSVPAGKYKLIISHLNYFTKVIDIEVNEGQITQIDAELKPQNIRLQEVSITGTKDVKPTETDLGLERITIQEVELLPQGIESDIFRILQTSTGVTSTGDVTAQYYVRGGGGDQNLVMLNGAAIYNPFHALGIFSVVDPEMISTLEFYKGGFSTEYGGRLSSILNIVTKDGNKNTFHGTASASLLSGKVALEGPIPYGSFIVTGRKSYYAGILENYLKKDTPFDFYDMSFKLNYANPNINKNGKLTFFGFFSGDKVAHENPLKEDFLLNNNIFGVNWRQAWSSPLFSVFSLSYSGFGAEVNPNLSKSAERSNRLGDVTANFDFAYVYDNKDELGLGVQSKYITNSLNISKSSGGKTGLEQSGFDLTIYSSYKFYRWETVGLQIGVRAKLSALSKSRPFIFEPRLSLNYRPSNLISLKAAFSRYSQELITLNNENEVVSIFQPWLIVPDGINAPEATDLITGLNYYISDKLSLEVETYYKHLTNLMDINPDKFTSQNSDYLNTNGESYGAEFTLKFQNEAVYMKNSYSIGRAFKIKNGVRTIPRYDVRHSVNLLLGYEFIAGWQATASWSLGSGLPFTPIAGFYDRQPMDNVWSDPAQSSASYPVVYWGDRNSKRLPLYHRLDLSVSKKFRIGIADVSLGMSVINVYDRKNIFYFDTKTGEEIYMLPILPSVSLKVAL